MTKQIFEVLEEGREKCGGCNYYTSNKYVLAENEEEAKRLYNEAGTGLCPNCFVEWLRDKEAKIKEEE